MTQKLALRQGIYNGLGSAAAGSGVFLFHFFFIFIVVWVSLLPLAQVSWY
jgi:hypothetical protein